MKLTMRCGEMEQRIDYGRAVVSVHKVRMVAVE